MAQLKSLLTPGKLLVAPGIYDGISARVADVVGFDVLYMTGYGAVGSHLGLPDAGLATYTEMVGRVDVIANAISVPLIADGDTAYGALLNVERTVRGYERAGAAAIQIEDQEYPKKCGHTPGKRVIDIEDWGQKIKVAAETRSSSDFLIVARTDARAVNGLDDALRRAEVAAEAGADILFVEAPTSEAEMQAICTNTDCPQLINVVEGGKTPVLPAETYAEIGYQVAIHPGAGFMVAAEAFKGMYGHIKNTNSSLGAATPMMDFGEISRIMGFEAVWDFESRHARD
jgi:2-methylisocitrate lyase-like PEP mutase family enzyme